MAITDKLIADIADIGKSTKGSQTDFFERAHSRMEEAGYKLIDYTTEGERDSSGQLKRETPQATQARQSHSLGGRQARDVTSENDFIVSEGKQDGIKRFHTLEGTQAHYQHPETGSVASLSDQESGYGDNASRGKVSERRRFDAANYEGMEKVAKRSRAGYAQIRNKEAPSREAAEKNLEDQIRQRKLNIEAADKAEAEKTKRLDESSRGPNKQGPSRAFGNESEAEDFIRNHATEQEVQEYVESGGSRGKVGREVLEKKYSWKATNNYGKLGDSWDHLTQSDSYDPDTGKRTKAKKSYAYRSESNRSSNFAHRDLRFETAGVHGGDRIGTDIPFVLDLESEVAKDLGVGTHFSSGTNPHDMLEEAEKTNGGFLDDPRWGKTKAGKDVTLEKASIHEIDELSADPAARKKLLDQFGPAKAPAAPAPASKPTPAPAPPPPVAAPPPEPAPAVSPAEVKAQPAATSAPRPTLYHGGRSGMSLDDIQIVREAGATKQGKKGRVYGGFYTTANIDEAEGYAKMAGEGNSVYQVDLHPDAVIEDYEGEVSRFSPKQIEEFRARNVDAVVGKDVRGRTEHVIFNKDAVVGLTDVSGNPQSGVLPSSTSPEPEPPAKLAQSAEEVAQAAANSEPIPQPVSAEDAPSVTAEPAPEPIRTLTQEEIDERIIANMDAQAAAHKERAAPGSYHDDPRPIDLSSAGVDDAAGSVDDVAGSAAKQEFSLPPRPTSSSPPGGDAPPPKPSKPSAPIPKAPRFGQKDISKIGNSFIEGELELTTRGLAGGLSSVINEWGYNRRQRVGGGTLDTKWGREWTPGSEKPKYAAPEIAKNGGHSAWKTVGSERQLHESWDEYITKSKGFGTGVRRGVYKFLGGKESSVNKWLAKVGGVGTIFPTAMAMFFAGKDAMEGYQKDGLIGGIRGAVTGYIQAALMNRIIGAAFMNPVRGALGAAVLITAGYVSSKVFDVRNQGNQYLQSKISQKTSWMKGVSSFSGTIPATMRARSLQAMENSRFGSLRSLGSEASMLSSPRARYSNTTKPWGSRQMLSF